MVGGGRPHRAPPAGNGGITRTGSMETWVVTRRRSGRMADGEYWDLTASACHRGGELPFLGHLGKELPRRLGVHSDAALTGVRR